jgi:ABC-type enterochelin transport system permease subunit
MSLRNGEEKIVGEENKSGSSWLSLELEIASIGAVLLALFTLTKAYAAAKFSLTTASALLTTAPFNVLLGSLTAYSYSVFPLLSLLTLSWAIWLFRREGGPFVSLPLRH